MEDCFACGGIMGGDVAIDLWEGAYVCHCGCVLFTDEVG